MIGINNIFKRGISFLLAVCMLLSPSYIEILAEAVDEVSGDSSPSFNVAFSYVNNGNTTLKPANDGDEHNDPFYMISRSDDISVVTKISIDSQFDDIRPDIYDLTLTLPYFYYNNGVLITTYNFSEIPEELRKSGQYMGIQARVHDKSNFGDAAKEEPFQSYVDEKGQTWARGKLKLSHESMTYEQIDSFIRETTPSFDVQFYDGNGAGAIVPENAAASIMLDFSCSQYYDKEGNTVSAKWSTDKNADDEKSKSARRLTFVNSNLKWETSIVNVPNVKLKDDSTEKVNSVMWDKYNYMVYELKIRNTSEDEKSVIDNFQMSVRAQHDSSGMRSVADKDIMQIGRAHV